MLTMSSGYYLDNDVILKTCSYGVGAELILLSTVDDLAPAILALARFTLRSRVERSRTLVDAKNAFDQLETVMARVRLLEPTREEIDMAADLEAAATAANLSFDAGESQLVSMLIARGGIGFITGDKRAAKAMSVVLPRLEARVICLEQVMHSVVVHFGIEPLRSSVCRERAADRAVTNCFQCSLINVDVPSVLEGLESYSRSLRSETGLLLVAGSGLSSPEVA